jgi:hypothetical protein
MYINWSSSSNSLIGSINGYNIMLYGHVNDRYYDYLDRIQEVTNVKYLKINNLLQRTLKIVKKNYKACLNPTMDKVRHAIRDELHFICEEDNTHFIIDLSILISGSTVMYCPNEPKIIDPQYKDLINKRIINEYDKILAFETLTTTVRLDTESTKNFNDQPTVASFMFPKQTFKVSKEDILYMTEPLLESKDTKIGDKAMSKIKRYDKEINLQ